MKKPTTPKKKATTKKKPATKKRSSSVRSKADKIKLSKKIFTDYETGEFTLESCCGENGITARTLTNWASSISEIADAFKKAKDLNAKATKEGLKKKAVSSLEKLIEGFSVEEEEVEEVRNLTGQIIQKKTKKKTKHFAPNVTAVIFALKAIDPDTWNNEQNGDGDGPGKQVFVINGKTIEF